MDCDFEGFCYPKHGHSLGRIMLNIILCQGFLPNELQIFGYARSKLTNEELRKKIRG